MKRSNSLVTNALLVMRDRAILSKTALRCKHCGEHISQYGPETFHIDSTMIRCENGETRAEVANE